VLSMVSAFLMWPIYTFGPWRSRDDDKGGLRDDDKGVLREAGRDEIMGMFEVPKNLVNFEPPVR